MESLTKRRTLQRGTLKLVSLLALSAFSGKALSQNQRAAELATHANLYDSITITRSQPDSNGGGFRVRLNNDLEAVNTTLIDIIAFAYNLHPKQIVNAPTWANQIAFELKLHYRLSGVPDDAACKEMLKQALKERFGLVLHGGGESTASYAIHVEPAGSKLARSLEMPGTLPALAMPKPGRIQAHNASLADLANKLQGTVLDRPVVDESGIKGRWDFELTWQPSPDEYSGRVTDSAPPLEKSLAEAMKRELGLRLDPAMAPPSDVILDHVQMPSGT